MHSAVSPSLANDSKYPLTQSPVGGLLGCGDGKAGGGGGAIQVERIVVHDEGSVLYDVEVTHVYFARNAVAPWKIREKDVTEDVSHELIS